MSSAFIRLCTLPHEVAIHIPKTLRASPRYTVLRFPAESIPSRRIVQHPKYNNTSPPGFGTCGSLLRIAMTLKQVNGVHAGPILEVNAALREHLLYGFNELVDKE